MRENRLSGSEGGATLIPSSLPLSIIQSLARDKLRLGCNDPTAAAQPPVGFVSSVGSYLDENGRTLLYRDSLIPVRAGSPW
jgi:hypothetical protein